MRVLPSLPRSAVGLTLLALLASGAPAQGKRGQALGRSDRPSNVLDGDQVTKVMVRPTHFEWSELCLLQESLPSNAFAMEEVLKALAQQPESTEGVVVDEVEVDGAMLRHSRRDHVRPSDTENSGTPGGIERLGPCVGFGAAPSASLSTAGQGDGPDSFATMFYPPNPAGSVGPNHLMVMAPNITLIQSRVDGSTIGTPVDTITFWSPAGAPTSVRHCRLYYDLVAERWLASALGGPESPVGSNTILLAISDSDDPTLGWDYYFWTADPTATTFADHPKMGYGANHVVIVADMFLGTANGQNRGTRLYILNKSELLTATVSGVIITGNDDWAVASGVFPGSFVNWRLQPSRALDTSDPDVWIWNSRATSGSNILFQVGIIGGPGGAPTLSFPFGAGLYLPDYNYTNVRVPMVQLAPEARGIDSLPPDGQQASNRARFHDAVVRNGHCYMVNSTGQPGTNSIAADRTNVNFYEVDISASPLLTPFVQAVPITNGVGTQLAFPSVAVNCANDVLIGMTSADSSKYLEAATCMRLGTDPLNTMGPVTTLKAGVDNWWQDAPAPQGNAGVAFTLPGLGAWGHYSTSSVDPNDGQTLWTLQPYAEARVGGTDPDSRWGTWWGRFGDCEIRPVIVDQPDSITDCVGNLASFTVSATTGSNVLTYQWRLDGNDIPGATSATYTIPVTTGADEGDYDVVICGCGQETSAIATLEFGEPTITTQPDHYTAGLGESAAFFVVATPSQGSLSYQWFHKGNPVGPNSNLLVIGPIQPGDFGPYYCVVSDGCGPVASTTVDLRPPPVFNKTKPAIPTDIVVTPGEQLGCVGDSVTFGIIAAPAGSTYQWRKDGVDLLFETNDTLVLSGLTFGSAGNYDVVVDTGTEILTSHDGVLDMGDNPVITDHPDDKTVSGSVMVIFSVSAIGHAPLHYQWRFSPPSAGNNFTDIPGANSPVLIIEQSYSFTAGRYRCAVSNPCGTTLSEIARLIIL